ncbi:hypothetical protein Q8W71_07050 [Methylobacterium sp. NEAU 140]|uniref:hypothetical protein n=1 Tax=Methylobacterium sp. NEAU 140 TaxID=3064945 RepID=UPI00273549EC|nr:hypothetical protein [Methylobacterium sp. NEAU 140]MDP4022373.1 hypothetical protein [Methylobacterium sp. NEAU 140]
MLLTALVALAVLWPRLDGALPAPGAAPQAAPATAEAAPSRYDPAARAVSNWHAQTGEHLLPRALALTASLSRDPPYVARCVRLNNGWCIKSARWPGEIGADAEGHTAFATLADGADAAAGLLRRYYRDYGRRSALAIVRRWAPAECRVAGAGSVLPARAGAGRAVPTPAVSAAVAPRGIGRTLRARFLARHRPGGAPRAALRVQPWSPLARMAGRPGARPAPSRVPSLAAPKPVPAIAAGIEAPARVASAARAPLRGADDPTALLESKRIPSPERMVIESAMLPAIAAGLPLLDLRLPAPLCSGDETRIRAYAGRIAGSVGLKPDDDLHLFDADGAALPNLAPVMLAMSAVELGTLRASPDLVAAAIGRLPPPRQARAAEASGVAGGAGSGTASGTASGTVGDRALR